MIEDNIARVAVIGTGQMGPGIAVVAALAGCDVTLIGRTSESLERGHTYYGQALTFLVENQLAATDEANAAAARLSLTCDIAAAGQNDLVIESIVEHLPTKQELFKMLDALCPPSTILATNTSGLRITEIAALMDHPERAVITHFYNPGHLIPLVEVVQGEGTSEETVQRAYAFLKRCHKRPVIGRKDVAGQIANRLQQAIMREAIYMVQEGIASAEDVEIALKAGPGLRWPVMGPLEHLDNVGLDLGIAVQSAVVPSLCSAAEPGQLLKDLVAAGHLGVRTGQGFHDWTQRDMAELVRRRNRFVADRVREAREAGEF